MKNAILSVKSNSALKTRHDLPEDIRRAMVGLLQSRLADAGDLQTQCKQAHWNVKGSNFIALHKLFDEINEAVEDYTDDVAERLVELGGIARGTARCIARESSLAEYPTGITRSADHLEALSQALAAFGKHARHAINKAADHGDADTADLFTEISRGIDKWLWFVEAHQQGEK